MSSQPQLPSVFVDGLIQTRCNSIADALELHLFCIKPLTCYFDQSVDKLDIEMPSYQLRNSHYKDTMGLRLSCLYDWHTSTWKDGHFVKVGPWRLFCSDLPHLWFRQWLVTCSVQGHYLNQCCLIFNYISRNKHKWNYWNPTMPFWGRETIYGNYCSLWAILYIYSDFCN